MGDSCNWVTGKYGSAVDFDGNADYIELGDIIFDSATEFSVVFWAKVDDLTKDNTFLSKGAFSTRVPVLFWRDESTSNPCSSASDTLTLLVSTGATDQRICSSSGSFNDNNWHFIVGTFKASDLTGLNLYLDGKQAATAESTATITSIESSSDKVRIGAPTPPSTTKDLDGLVDNYMILNRVLTREEIYQLYISNLNKYDTQNWSLYVNQSKNATTVLDDGTYTYYASVTNGSGSENITTTRTIIVDTTSPIINFTYPTLSNASTTTNTSIKINISITDLNEINEIKYNWNGTNFTMYNDSLIFMMNFDNITSIGENYTRNATNGVVDISKYKNNGTLGDSTAGTNPTWNLTGKYNGAFEFDGDDDFIELGAITPGHPLMFANSNLTITAWFYKYAGNSWQRIIDKSDGGTAQNGYAIYVQNDNDINIAVDGNTITADAGAQGFALHENWIHMAAVISDSYYAIYLNGINITGITWGSGDSPTQPPNVETNMRIGTWNHNTNREWNGTLDEIQIWNRTLSEEEIYQLYASNLNKFNQTQWYLYVNQSTNSTSGLNNADYTYFISVKDKAGNSNQTETRTVTISSDTTYPTFSGYYDNNASIISGGVALFNVTVENTNGTVFLTINGSDYYVNNVTSNVYNLSISGLINETYLYNWSSYGNGSSANLNVSSNRYYTVNVTDTDGDGVSDNSDKLLYNETNVTTSGVSELNITIGGNSTSSTFSISTEEILFYDQSDLIVNFSHNFSQSNLDLSKITISKTSTSLIFNLSGQLQGNKTLYITDNSFVSLCVKDEEINSIDEISSDCTGSNETNFNSCLGSVVRINGINCTDDGSTIKIENLKYSGIRGIQADPSGTSSTSGSGSGGRRSKKVVEEDTIEKFKCVTNSDCSEDKTCFYNQCVK